LTSAREKRDKFTDDDDLASWDRPKRKLKYAWKLT